MNISHYSFGRIDIAGQTYVKDVIVFPERVFSPWWRKEGHLLCTEDLAEVFKANTRVLIVGTGYYDTMKVPEDVIEALRLKGVKLHVENTQKAVTLYNRLSPGGEVAAALHLTC